MKTLLSQMPGEGGNLFTQHVQKTSNAFGQVERIFSNCVECLWMFLSNKASVNM